VQLTLGLRGFETAPLHYLPRDAYILGTPGGTMRAVSPFVALTVFGWS